MKSEQATPHGFNKGRSSMIREDSQVQQTPEEGRRTFQPKHSGNNNKDEDNSPKTLNDKRKNFLQYVYIYNDPYNNKCLDASSYFMLLLRIIIAYFHI